MALENHENPHISFFFSSKHTKSHLFIKDFPWIFGLVRRKSRLLHLAAGFQDGIHVILPSMGRVELDAIHLFDAGTRSRNAGCVVEIQAFILWDINGTFQKLLIQWCTVYIYMGIHCDKCDVPSGNPTLR